MYVKQATNTCNLFRNIAAERVNKHVMPALPSTFKPVLKQIKVAASWVNTDFWLDTIMRESRHRKELRYLLQNKFASGR